MFGKKEAKKQRKLAEEAQKRAEALQTQAAQPTPLQSAEDKANLEFLDWESGKNGPVDIEKAPGMNPYLDLYRASTAVADSGGYAGKGLFQLGQDGANPNMVAAIDKVNSERRRQVAGGALADAYRQRSAQAHGYVLPSSSLSTSRALSVAGMAGGRADNAWARYLEQMNRSGFFNSNLFNTFYGNAQRAATMGAGG